MKIFAMMIYASGVGHINKPGQKIYSFFDDYANTFVIFGVFFFVYFARGLFTVYMERQIDSFKKYVSEEITNKIANKRNLAQLIIKIGSIAIMLFSGSFLITAKKQGDLNWYYYFGNGRLVFFCFLIMYCWVLTANLFITIIYHNYCLTEYLKQPLNSIDYYNADKCFGTKKIIRSLAASLGFGIYFLMHIAVLALSDYRALTIFHLELGFYKNWKAILLFVIAVAALYFTSVICAYFRLKFRLTECAEKKIQELQPFSKERIFLEKTKVSLLNFRNLFTFVSSFAIPAISAVVTILQSVK